MPATTIDPAKLPQRKVGVGAMLGSVVTIGVWGVNSFTQVVVPAEVALAITTVLYFVVQYMVPNREL